MCAPEARVIGPRARLLQEVAAQSLGALDPARRTHGGPCVVPCLHPPEPQLPLFPWSHVAACDKKLEVPLPAVTTGCRETPQLPCP